MLIKIALIFSVIALSAAVDYRVKTAVELKDALAKVSPGDFIYLADGTYVGLFRAFRSGASGRPITITGSRNAILKSDSYGFHLKANYWVIKGFTVSNSKKGIVLDSSSFNILENLSIRNINEEAVHFRYGSSDNIIRTSQISYTGLTSPGTGEGVYIGSSDSNWLNNSPDLSHRNKVLNNHFGPGISAEAIDVKEGTESGVISGNTFDGTGMSGQNYADSWIDVKGAKYTISDNKGVKSLLDGIQVHQRASLSTSGCGNVISNNSCSRLGAGGVCVNLYKNPCGNKSSNNVVV